MAEHEVQCGNTSTRLGTRSKVNYDGHAGPVMDTGAESEIDMTLRNIGTVDSEINFRGDVDSSSISDEEFVDENVKGIEVDPWKVARDREATAETEDVSKKGVDVEKILSGFRFVNTCLLYTSPSPRD